MQNRSKRSDQRQDSDGSTTYLISVLLFAALPSLAATTVLLAGLAGYCLQLEACNYCVHFPYYFLRSVRCPEDEKLRRLVNAVIARNDVSGSREANSALADVTSRLTIIFSYPVNYMLSSLQLPREMQ